MIPEIVEEPTYSYPKANSQQAIISYISYLKEVKSKKIDEETLREFSKSAQKVINFSDNWLNETTFSKSVDELMRIVGTTLDNFKEYFQTKFSPKESHSILENLGRDGIFFLTIPNPPIKDSLISTMQEYSSYLVKLVTLLENKNLDKDESSKIVLDSLAKFPGKEGQVDFACLEGTTQRIRDQSMVLDKITFIEQAVKNILTTTTSQLASSISRGNQIHLDPCLLSLLHLNPKKLSEIDHFYSAPIREIELKKALTFISNFPQKFDEEINQIVDALYQDYQKIPLTAVFTDNNARENFVTRLNLAIKSSSTNPMITQEDIFEFDTETFQSSLKSQADFNKIILTKIKNSQPESMDFLREFSTLPTLFCESGDVNFLDITKIDDFLKLFELNQGKSKEKEEIDITIGIKTLHLLAEKFKSSNILFLACFFEKFEGPFDEKFEDFFYQTNPNGATKIIKPEYEKYKNLIESTVNLYNSNLIKYYGSDIELLNFHKQIYQIGNISDRVDEDLEKKEELRNLISSTDFNMELKTGESNILHYPRQFFGKNTIKFILEKIPEEAFLYLIQLKLVGDNLDRLNNLNPLQIATYKKDQEMLSLFLDLKFNHPKRDLNQAPLGADDKFEFIKNNKLLSISLKNNDLKTFNFLLEQFDGVDMVAKIKDGIANNDAEILEILDLVTKRENLKFFNALKFIHPIDDSISNKLTENAFKNDNSNMLTKLGMVDITPHLAKISYKSENIIKKFFDRNFFEKNPIYAKRILSEAFKKNQLDTAKYLIESCNALDSFGNNELKNFLLQSIKHNKIEISELLIEKFLSPKSICAYVFGGANYPNLNSIIPHTRVNGTIYQTTYLQFACENNRKNIAELLIQKGAKITDNCFIIAIKTINKDILNLLIKSEMENSGKTKLEVLKEKSPLIFKKFSQNFDLKILKNLFDDLNDSEKKELLNFKIDSGLFCIRSESTVFDKISKVVTSSLPINETLQLEVNSYIDDLKTIKNQPTQGENQTAQGRAISYVNADLVIQQQPQR